MKILPTNLSLFLRNYVLVGLNQEVIKANKVMYIMFLMMTTYKDETLLKDKQVFQVFKDAQGSLCKIFLQIKSKS